MARKQAIEAVAIASEEPIYPVEELIGAHVALGYPRHLVVGALFGQPEMSQSDAIERIEAFKKKEVQ
ncbi:hypothetical protein ACWS7L_07465 [Exiguobacterium artemiae]